MKKWIKTNFPGVRYREHPAGIPASTAMARAAMGLKYVCSASSFNFAFSNIFIARGVLLIP
ncbi:MAG: hypothetical protein KKH02_11030 [Proteobacteria bacterium]|nr:hypothetical protein [Pseudomonadota bacterium]MBU4582926.1 hypothetical protein [Pseudomonadota bacterium]MCG2741560.1 hypothetical protein [Syntrophaceae bacterium]